MGDRNATTACLQTLGTGVAIADAKSWAIEFENANFFNWFAPGAEPDALLTDRLTDLKVDRAQRRLEEGRPFSYETEIKAGARTLSIAVELRKQETDDGDVIIAECRNVTKQKEAEYMLDSYSRMAEKNARELQREKERVEKLLLNVMPRSIYEELRDFGTTTPQRFDNATVLMLDFVSFTDMTVSSDPGALITELNDIFSAFDRIAELFGCERIKTIGDAYVAVSGLPEPTADHAPNIAKVALRMRRYLEKRNASNPTEWLCRIGIATGPLIGSMVGIQKYVYDIFGPAVNLASRLEELCEPMKILIDDQTWQMVREDFATSEFGEVEIKGFDTRQLYGLEYEIHGRI